MWCAVAGVVVQAHPRERWPEVGGTRPRYIVLTFSDLLGVVAIEIVDANDKQGAFYI